MNAIFAPKPFSAFELVAGGAALAPVALIAFFGLRVPQAQDPLPPAPSSLSTASIPVSPSLVQATDEQLSESSQNAGADRTPRPADAAPAGDATILAEPGNANAAASPAADRPLTAATWRLGRWRSDDAAGVQQRLLEAGLLWGFADGTGDAEAGDARPGVLLPDAVGADAVWDRPTQGPLATSSNPSSAESRTAPSTQDRAAPAAVAPSPAVAQKPPRAGSGRENTFVGGWADDAGECRQGQNHDAPLVISIHAARTAGGECDFRSVRREAASRWRIVAQCSREGESWASHVDLKLAGPNLTWSSERGTAKYVRCLKP